MFDKLIDAIKDLGANALPFVVLDPNEKGILVRLGKVHRFIESGFYWRIPFVDALAYDSVVPRTVNLRTQSLTTSDDTSVCISVSFIVEIVDIEAALFGVEEFNDAVIDISQGVMGDLVNKSTWEHVRHENFNKEIEDECKKRLKKFGARVTQLRITDLLRARPFRVITGE